MNSTETFSKYQLTQINSKDLESQLSGARLVEVQELKNGPPGTNPTGCLSRNGTKNHQISSPAPKSLNHIASHNIFHSDNNSF